MATCEHPESLHYVLALDSKEPITEPWPVIIWCRGCGAISGWKPADRKSNGDEWQAPDGVIPDHEATMRLLDRAADVDSRHRRH